MLRRAVILVCCEIWKEGNTRVYNFASCPSPMIANINGEGRALGMLPGKSTKPNLCAKYYFVFGHTVYPF
jgi:hypothetical protein